MINYRPIEQQFRETAGEIRQGMPRLVIGKPNTSNPYNDPRICPYCKRPYNLSYIKQSLPKTTPDKDYAPLFTKIRNWGLLIIVSIVIGYAIYRLVWGFIL